MISSYNIIFYFLAYYIRKSTAILSQFFQSFLRYYRIIFFIFNRDLKKEKEEKDKKYLKLAQNFRDTAVFTF
jgi:hypothetical protein